VLPVRDRPGWPPTANTAPGTANTMTGRANTRTRTGPACLLTPAEARAHPDRYQVP
jgi:hypothetical protein